MKLSITKSTKNKVVTVTLETVEFCQKEHLMLDQIGEPIIEMDKMYGNNTVKFAKKIRSNFKVKVKFDGNLDEDTDVTADYISEFLEDIQEKLAEAMGKVSDEYNDFLTPTKQVIAIKY